MKYMSFGADAGHLMGQLLKNAGAGEVDAIEVIRERTGVSETED